MKHSLFKKLLLLTLTLMAFTTATEAGPVDLRQARDVGARFVNGNTRMRTTANDLCLVTTYSTDDGVAAFHVFNTSNGFVIVAADDCSIPILAYSEEGQFDVNNIPVQMEGYLQVYRREIQHGIQHRLTADESISKQWNMLRTTGNLRGTRSNTSVAPLLSTMWNQDCYYNALCPEDTLGPCGHVYAGCVATAMGQIMRYWQYPEVGSGSHSYSPSGYPDQTVDFGATTYDWDNMPTYLNNASSEEQINAIATLLWHCGVAVNMMYGPYGSGSYTSDVPYALTEYFNYSDDIYGLEKTDNESWLALIKSNLDSGLPVMYSASDTNGGGSHAFVCDGYDANDYLHFNWGWSGTGNNAYYALDALNVNGYQYNDYNYAVFNIYPENTQFYQITAEANPEEGGTVNGAGSLPGGSVCTLTALGAYDYVFVNWIKDGVVVSTNPVISFEVTEDATYTANFELFEGVTVGEGSVVTNEFFPSYSYYCHSLTEQIYTSEDLQQTGVIRTLAFYNDGTTKTQDLDIYLAYTDKNAFASTTDWIAVTENDLVFSGVVTLVAGTWTALTLDNPFVYDGSLNLALVVDNNTGSWTNMPNMACRVFYTNGNQAIRVYSDEVNYDPYNPSAYTGTLYSQKNQLRIAFDEVTPSYSSVPIVTPDPLALGYRPNNAWMRPYTFQIYNPGNYTYINSITTDNPYFQLEDLEAPFVLGYHQSLELDMTTSNGEGEEEGHLIINYGDNQTLQYDLSAVAYDPAIKDVWETAYEVTSFPFTDNLVVSEIPLYNNYDLPPVEVADGADAVYKLVFDQDVSLSASIIDGENGKIALYTEDFYGEGGPMATNYFKDLNIPEVAAPFEVQIGEGTSTTSGYFPFYCLYNYSLSQQLFTAAELEEAGVTSANMTSLSWYCTSTNGNLQSNITIWMANVEETSIGTSSMVTGSMAKVYEGDMIPVANEWNEFVFNQGTFVWDGTSNILISVQRNNGAWASGVNWQVGAQSFIAGGYSYTDASAYDMAANTYTFGSSGSIYGATTTNRANIIMKGGNREGNRDEFTYDFEGGMQGWTSIDNDGDGNGWFHSSLSETYSCYSYEGYGHNSTDGFALSQSYTDCSYNSYDADNYLVSPQRYTLGTGASLNFYFDYSSDDYPDYFEVCVATANNPTANDFTSVWNVNLRSNAARTQIRHNNNRNSNWREVTVDLSAYAGQKVWIAFHHQDYDEYELWIDDVTINAGDGVTIPSGATVPHGTYYLVASSTSDAWGIEINTEALPCPEMAFDPIPANYGTEVTPTAVPLQWSFGEGTTEYKLMFGLDPDNMSTLVDWTRNLAESYVVSGLLNNTDYYWQIMERNDGCPDGVEGPVWEFTTQLNAPYLYNNGTAIFEGDVLWLSWEPLADTCILSYNIYQDNVLIGNTISNYFSIEGLTYNMEGYYFYLTAMYAGGESNPSNSFNVYVSGYGDVNGYVFEQDGITGIENATVTYSGQDEHGFTNTFVFTTNSDGYYTGILKVGNYYASTACSGYSTTYEPLQGNPIVVNHNDVIGQIDFILDENFDPVQRVVAEYYPDAEDPNSPYVKVYSGAYTNILFDFDDHTMQGWTTIDANNDNYTWCLTSDIPSTWTYYASQTLDWYHSGSDAICSGSYINGVGALYPDEWLISPAMNLFNGSQLNFWVAATDASYAADHFGVFVSTTGTEPGDFTSIQEWTLTAKKHSMAGGDMSRNGKGLRLGNWYNFTVDLSAYAGHTCHIAFRHYNCTDQYIMCLDDINISIPRNINPDRSFSHYRYYRTDAYNYGPFTEENTVLLADYITDSVFIDVTWENAEAGVYKYGMSRVYSGNREGGSNTIQSPRESEIVWSTPIDKDIYLGENEVSISVTLNSGDSPEGVLVNFTNLNPVEQELYPIDEIILDATGYYAFDSIRRGNYQVQLSLNGYETVTEEVSIWDATELNYVLNEILYTPNNLYVSSTGWAMWEDEQHGNTVPIIEETVNTFSVDFEEGLPADWTVIDANNDGYTWCLTSAIPTTWTYFASITLDWYHNGTNAICSGSYINGVGALNPDEYLISPRVDIVNGSQLSFWVAATDANYAADHFGVFVSTTGTNPEDFTSVQEWTLTAKGKSKAGNDRASREGKGLRMATWRNYIVDLSAYAGNACYIAFRHYNCYDQYVMCIDDVELNDGTEGKSNRHFNQYQVVLSDAEDNIIYEEAISDCYLQLPVENLVDDETYHLKIASVYSSGLSEWNETDWVYQSCSNFEGFSELTAEFLDEGNTISWNYPALVNNSFSCKGAMIYREGELLGFTRGTSYTDTIVTGNHEYEIRTVYNGAAELPYNNMYYSMSCPQSIGGATYEVTVAAEPEEYGVVTGAGSYINGFPCTLTATVNPNYLFLNWTVNGEIVSTEPTYTFLVTEDATCIAHFSYGQDTPLVAGWNWWSTYVEQEGIDGLLQLENSLGGAGIRIQGHYGSTDYFEYEGTGYWYGPLNGITNEQMYKIRTNDDCNATISGNPLEASNHPVTINYGWNWIGFTSDHSIDINDALSGLTAEPNDIIKGRNASATYVSSGEYNLWYGPLNTLEPGHGYMYKSNNYTSKTLVYQTERGNGEVKPNITPFDNYYVPADANYADNMLITAVIEVDGEELRSEAYELAAFAGDECRGSVKLMYIEPFDRYVAFLLVFGDEAESLHFVLTDGRGMNTSREQITYSADGTTGTLTDPVTLHFGTLGIEDGQLFVNIYPNPSKGLFNIEGIGIQKVEVVNTYGQVILSNEVENDYLQINLADQAAGTYLLRVVTANGIITRKLVTTK